MKLDAVLAVDAAHMRDVAGIARAADAIGFAGLWTAETKHNSFFPLLIAAEHSQRIDLGTAVAIAFPRSPMITAQIAWDLQALSGGRFILGLGTQVRAHIERRFSMTWEAPVAKLRDYIEALRAIWNTWQTGAKLDFQGQFYNHTLMTPFFDPGPIATPHIPIYIAGVNERLARLAGELCQGFHVHPFHSVRYINEVVRPQVTVGAARSGRSASDVVLASGVFVITGPDEATIERMRAATREQIAFYASTPTYRVVMAVHGWQDVGEQLSRLASKKRWDQMGALITDQMLQVFAVQAPLDRLGQALRLRYEGILDRVSCYLPFVAGECDDAWRDIAAVVHGSD
jgi:probable F420-dependent oxidoreductase